MIGEVVLYCSAFGAFGIPPDVRARATRLALRFGRTGYLDDWCRWQWQQGRN